MPMIVKPHQQSLNSNQVVHHIHRNSINNSKPPNCTRSFSTERKSANPSISSQRTRS